MMRERKVDFLKTCLTDMISGGFLEITNQDLPNVTQCDNFSQYHPM